MPSLHERWNEKNSTKIQFQCIKRVFHEIPDFRSEQEK